MRTSTHRRVALLSLALLASAGPVAAQTAPEEVVGELLRVTRFEEGVKEIRGTARQRVGVAFTGVGTERRELEALFVDVQVPESIPDAVARRLVAVYDPDAAQAVLEWHRSALGKKIDGISLRLATPEGQAELVALEKRLAETPPSRELVAKARRLDIATRSSERLLAAMVTLTSGMRVGVARVLDPERDPRRDVQRLSYAYRRELRPSVTRRVQAVFLQLLESLSEEEAASYDAFVHSAGFVWFNETSVDALLRALEEASEAWNDAIERWVARHSQHADRRRAADEGRAFAASTETPPCVSEAVARGGKCMFAGCHAAARSFMAGCLEAHEGSKALCKELPKRARVETTALWRAAVCQRAGRSDALCRSLLAAVQHWCEDR